MRGKSVNGSTSHARSMGLLAAMPKVRKLLPLLSSLLFATSYIVVATCVATAIIIIIFMKSSVDRDNNYCHHYVILRIEYAGFAITLYYYYRPAGSYNVSGWPGTAGHCEPLVLYQPYLIIISYLSISVCFPLSITGVVCSV
jgi:hypothetical protein